MNKQQNNSKIQENLQKSFRIRRSNKIQSPSGSKSNFYSNDKRSIDFTNRESFNSTKYSNFAFISAEGYMKALGSDYYSSPKNKRTRIYSQISNNQSPSLPEKKLQFLKKGQFKPYIKQNESSITKIKPPNIVKKIPDTLDKIYKANIELTSNELVRRYNYFVSPQKKISSDPVEFDRVIHPTVVATNSPEWFHINDHYMDQKQIQLPHQYSQTKILKGWQKSDLRPLQNSFNYTFNPQISRRFRAISYHDTGTTKECMDWKTEDNMDVSSKVFSHLDQHNNPFIKLHKEKQYQAKINVSPKIGSDLFLISPRKEFQIKIGHQIFTNTQQVK